MPGCSACWLSPWWWPPLESRGFDAAAGRGGHCASSRRPGNRLDRSPADGPDQRRGLCPVVVNNIVYAGGSFSRARPAGAAAGTQEVVRDNFVAYNVTTGVMATTFAPNFNGTIETITLSPDGTTLFVVGGFTTGQRTDPQPGRRLHHRRWDAHLTPFNPNVNSTVLGAAATATTLYIGGNFTSVNGVPGKAVPLSHRCAHHRDRVTRRCRPAAPSPQCSSRRTATRSCRRQLHQHERIKQPGVRAGDARPTNGANLSLPVNTVIRNGGANSAIYDLAGNASGLLRGRLRLQPVGRQPRGHVQGRLERQPHSGSRTATATTTRFSRPETRSTSPAMRTTAATSAASRRPTRGRTGPTNADSPSPTMCAAR